MRKVPMAIVNVAKIYSFCRVKGITVGALCEQAGFANSYLPQAKSRYSGERVGLPEGYAIVRKAFAIFCENYFGETFIVSKEDIVPEEVPHFEKSDDLKEIRELLMAMNDRLERIEGLTARLWEVWND